jgi:DnaJ-class molecular chaperone
MNTAGALLALITTGYAVACAYRPFADCRRCRGTGRWRSVTRRAVTRCPRCWGTGIRLRTGRRLFDLVRTAQRPGTHRPWATPVIPKP